MSSNIRILIAECVGAFLLVFMAVGGAVLAVAAKVGVTGVSPGTTVMASALGAGLVLLGVLVSVGPFARIHLRPAVTFALVRRRTVAVDAAVDSWIGQAIGAVGAGFALYLLIPWATEGALSATSSTAGAPTLAMQDVLIAALASVLLLAAPMVGVALVAIFSTPDRLLIGAPAPVVPLQAVFIPQPDIAPEPPVAPEADVTADPEPELDPIVATDPRVDVEEVSEPEPVTEPLVAEAPDAARQVVFASAEATTSRPSPPRATLTPARVAHPATRVVAPFPPAPAPSPFPLRREVAPARHGSAFSAAAARPEPDVPKKKAKDATKHPKAKDKKDKGRKPKGKRKSKSTVTVQVKVTDKQGKKGRKK